tara:strand:- start:693 stop:1652 length:960 start_codon:yes stop_codon:yes gene_type:complete
MPAIPTTLVLSSGGIRGVAHVGVLQALAQAGWIGSKVHTVIGTSAGALVGMLLVLQYTPDEIARLVREYDFSGLSGDVGMYPSHLLRVPRSFGAVDSKHAPLGVFVRTVVQKSRVAKGDTDLTLGTLKQRTSCALVVCATDTWTSNPVYFGPGTHPEMPVATAVITSCNIPFYFTPVQGRYVDGALVDHYPFKMATDPLGHVIGIVIVDDADQVDDDVRGADSLVEYVRRLVRVVETSGTKRTLADTDIADRTIVVRCPRGVGAFERREEYLEAGACAARAFIERQNALRSCARITPGARAKIARVLHTRRRSKNSSPT